MKAIRQILRNLTGLILITFFASACATHTVKSTVYTPVISDSRNVPEDLLLDVGIAIFDPGIDEIERNEEETTNHDIRVAESRYAPYLLSETLQPSDCKTVPLTSTSIGLALLGINLTMPQLPDRCNVSESK
jgi:hypothetical protein